uniref:fibrinogen-like protein 1 n=1 Tax=Doryrhamphus excisus TaxID=161450 RepID=UPI0025ADCBA8|nr:fibrinogen-like protein 1 [Doryrhamphus excisus]
MECVHNLTICTTHVERNQQKRWTVYVKIDLICTCYLLEHGGLELENTDGLLSRYKRFKRTEQNGKSWLECFRIDLQQTKKRMADLLRLLMVVTLCYHSFCASDQCSEELTRLREQQKLLQSQLQQQDLLLRRLRLLNQAANMPNTAVDQNPQTQTQHQDCSQLFNSGFKASGYYSIQPQGTSAPVRVYCDMSEGGGWTLMQRRINGAENFSRSWVEYKNGFGNMVADLGEFWLGNDNLHYITAQGNYTLAIHLEDFDGSQRHAEYRNFKVADEKDLYRLTFGAYTGTAGDALSGNYQAGVSEWASHQGIPFSTYDKDNDNYQGSCAQEDKGGWWFNKCHAAHLNGRYYPSGYYSGLTDDGVVWYTWRGWWYSLKTSIMKLRPDSFKVNPSDDPNMVRKA